MAFTVFLYLTASFECVLSTYLGLGSTDELLRSSLRAAHHYRACLSPVQCPLPPIMDPSTCMHRAAQSRLSWHCFSKLVVSCSVS